MVSLLIISDRDNVGTALEALPAGHVLDVGGRSLVVRDPIPRGHKVAIHDVAAGAAVVKYGSPIGTATADIPAGAHVHTHNVASGRGRGDLAAGGARIAEPPE